MFIPTRKERKDPRFVRDIHGGINGEEKSGPVYHRDIYGGINEEKRPDEDLIKSVR